MSDAAYPPPANAPYPTGGMGPGAPPPPAYQPPNDQSMYGAKQQGGYGNPQQGGYGNQQMGYGNPQQAGYNNPGFSGPPPQYPQQGGYSSGHTVVVQQPGTHVIMQGGNYMPDSTGAIIFSCAVAWCCCCILGIIAFVYAVTATSGRDATEARRKIGISMKLSIAGLCIGIGLYVLITILRIALAASASS